MRWSPQRLPFEPGPDDRPIKDKYGRTYWVVVPPEDHAPRRLTLICNDEVAGCVEIDWWPPDQIENFGILIEEAYRQCGLGSALLQEFIALARQKGATVIRGFVRQWDLEARPFLLQWYARQGFTITASHSITAVANLSLVL